MKRIEMDEATLREFKKLAALVQNQSGIRLNVEQVVKARDEQTLRVWEKTLRDKGEARKF